MGKKATDLTGQTFADGNLTVLNKAPSGRRVQWVCRCNLCGNTTVVRGDYLKAGLVKSCGCLPKGRQSEGQNKEELRKSSSSLDNLEFGEYDDPYQNLANAIIAVAADDYRTALKENNPKLKKSLEKFFHSEWYKVLTSVNPDTLMGLLHKEHNDELSVVYT